MTELPHADQRLIEGIAKGDYKILDEIYSKYSTAILKMVREKNGTPDDAKDVMQEGLVIIYKKSQNADFILTSGFFTFFYSVCRNIWWRMLQKNSNKPTNSIDDTLPIDSEIDIEQEILERERHEFYLKKMKELSAGCRQLLEFFLEGKTMREITSLLGFGSEGYARKRKYKCKEQLLNKVKQDPNFRELL
jgi:RNA polymerase sigma factor (sigma-70 family)